MSIFSLVKGGKEHEVFEMRMCGRGGDLNSYVQTRMCKPKSPKHSQSYHFGTMREWISFLIIKNK